MDKQTEGLSVTEIINGLHETIWCISDSIGVSLEVAEGRIPQRCIDSPALAKRLLVEGMAQVGQNLELLRVLEENMKSRTHKEWDKTRRNSW